MATVEKSFPCLQFKLDTKKGFGECSCGFTQPDHKPDRRKQLKDAYLSNQASKKNSSVIAVGKKKEEDENQLSETEASSVEPCEKFTFDPNMPYNTCKCGFTKVQHDEAKIRREKEKKEKLEEEKKPKKTPRQEAMEKGVPCPDFEVDLGAKGGYGVCLCGFNRQDHKDYRASPEIWIKKKAELTEPKPFI